MAKVIDISSKLVNEPKFLQVTADKTYRIDDRKNTVIKMYEILNSSNGNTDFGTIEKVLTLTLGKDAVKELDDMELSFEAYQALFLGVMAAITGRTYEDIEKSFRTGEGI